MPVYRDEHSGTWFSKFYARDWRGENKQIKKRGFATKHDAQEYERTYKMSQSGNLDMPFGKFLELYVADTEARLKRSTWHTKEHILRTKLLPFFGDMKMNEITASDVLKWQNELLDYRDARGRGYSSAYQKAIHHQLSSVFNHACKYYRLKENPARLAGYMGKDDLREMHIWSTEEYKRFSQAIRNKPMSFYMFEVLFWTGMREGECLALTKADFDLEGHRVRISKSYHRLHGEDLITTPKTAKSNRTIRLPRFLSAELADYFSMIPDVPDTERIFPVTKNYLYHEMKRGCQKARVKQIRIHDLRHSHVSQLIHMGFSAVAIAERLGHESIDITYRYAHLFPSTQEEMAERLEAENERPSGN